MLNFSLSAGETARSISLTSKVYLHKDRRFFFLKWGHGSFKKRHEAHWRKKDKGEVTNIILNLNITCSDLIRTLLFLRVPRYKGYTDDGRFYYIYRERGHGRAFLAATDAKETRERYDAKVRAVLEC